MSDYTVRPLEEKDLQMVLEWRNSDHVHSKMLTNHKITWDEHYAWFHRSKENHPCRNLIFEYQGRAIGYIGYTEYDEEKKSCSPGAYLGVSDVPMEAVFAIFYMSLKYAFEDLHMDYIESSILQSNKIALMINKKLGCVRLENAYEVCVKGNKEEKAYRYKMTKEEWQKNKNVMNI